MWRYYAKLHWSFAIFTLRFCSTNMYWVYISNIAYQGQVYAGRLTKIIAMWTVYGVNGRACACMSVSIWKVVFNYAKQSFEPFFSLVCFHGVFLCFPAYSQHFSTSVDIFLNTVADMLRAQITCFCISHF